MTVTFPKQTDVQVRTNAALYDLIREFVATIGNHLTYVDDSVTKQRWEDLVCNGIDIATSMTVGLLAQILDITDEETSSQLSTVVQILFDELTVLKLYWSLTKVNLKSVCIQRLKIDSNKVTLARLTRQITGYTTSARSNYYLHSPPHTIHLSISQFLLCDCNSFQLPFFLL